MQRLRPRRLDALVAGAIALVGVVEAVAGGYEPTSVAIGTFVAAAGILAFAQAIPLALPPLVATVYFVTPLAGFDVSQPVSWIPVVAFASFAAGRYAPRSQWPFGFAGVLVALAITYATLTWLTDFEPSVLFGVIMSFGPWALGFGLREALDRERHAGAEAARARSDAALATERAVASERERIAAELHDLLAHALGAMVVQSSAAGDRVRRAPAEAARALNAVAQAGRDALSDTGALLRLLRDDEGELGLSASRPLDSSGTPAAPPGRRHVPYRDVFLPSVFGVVATAEFLIHDYGPLWPSLAASWATVLVLVARRAFPVAMPLAVIGTAAVARLAGVDVDDAASSLLTGGLAFFAAGRHVTRARLPHSFAAVLAATALLVLHNAAFGDFAADALLLLLFAFGPWTIGAALRAALDRTRRLAAEAEAARFEKQLAAERAVAAERRRIARELHDALANSLSVMVVQASLAAELVLPDPERAAAAVAEVERSGRAALGETGRLIRLIDEGADPGVHPQPGLPDLPALAGSYERAGLTVDLDGIGAERLPARVEVSIYRVVQEALTNAVKHAPGSAVRVTLSRRPTAIAVEVVNGRPRSNGHPPVPSGHGLTGLRERVSLFGGRLDARPTADGGFVLAASIPLAEAQ